MTSPSTSTSPGHRPMLPCDVLSICINSLLETVRSQRSLSDETLLSMHVLLGSSLSHSLTLLDHGPVRLFHSDMTKEPNLGQWVWIVTEPTGRRQEDPVVDVWCSVFACSRCSLLNNPASYCSHQLAGLIADALGRIVVVGGGGGGWRGGGRGAGEERID